LLDSLLQETATSARKIHRLLLSLNPST